MTPHDRIRKLNRDIANMRSTLAILERLIAPGIVSLTNAVGDGHPQKGDGPTSGISDPVGAAIARASPAFELDTQLRMTWVLMTEAPNAVANLLRQATSLTPVARPIVSACAAGIHLAGYGVWGRRDTYGAPVRCDEIGEPDRDGLCLGCDKRRQRWRTSEKVAT